MDIKTVFLASFLVLVLASGSESWQNPPPGPGSNNPQSPYRASTGYAAPPAGSNAYPRPVGPPRGGDFRQGYANQFEQGSGNRYPGTLQNQFPGGARQNARPFSPEPTYPYPQHHNPYYKGQSVKDVFGGAIDWIVSVPGVLVNGVTQLLDNRVFPQVPATHGGPSRPNENPPQSAVDRNLNVKPLPQGETYRPNRH